MKSQIFVNFISTDRKYSIMVNNKWLINKMSILYRLERNKIFDFIDLSRLEILVNELQMLYEVLYVAQSMLNQLNHLRHRLVFSICIRVDFGCTFTILVACIDLFIHSIMLIIRTKRFIFI